MYWERQIGSTKWLSYTDDQCRRLTNAFTSKNIPVFLGETTSRYPRENFASGAKYTDSSECLEIVLDKLTDLGFVPVLWDTSNNFYSRTNCKIKSEADSTVIRKISDKLAEK